MFRLPRIILARKIVALVIDRSQCFDCFVYFFYLFNPLKMPTSKILGGSFEPLETPHPTGLRFTPKYQELDRQMLEWFSDQREQGECSSLHVKLN